MKVGCKLLEYMGLRPRKFDIISCPSCGRSQVDVIQLANAVTEGLKDVTAPIRVAVMGCIVNGPGEAREADLGVASGNGKGQIFIKGKSHSNRAGRPDCGNAAGQSAGDRRADGSGRTGARQRHRTGGGAGGAR